MITLNFYSLTEDPRKVSKTPTPAVVGPGAATSLSGTFKDPVDTFEPRVIVELGDSYIHAFNYVQIYEWSKYYFVVDKEILQKGLVRLYLREDVRMTWSSAILASDGMVTRTASNLKPFLTDSRRVLSSNTTKSIILPSDIPTGEPTLAPTGNENAINFMIDMVNPQGAAHTNTVSFSGVSTDIVPIQGEKMATGGVFSSRYATSFAQLKLALTTLATNPITSLFGATTEGVINCICFPCNITAVASATLEEMKMLNQGLQGQGYPMVDNPYQKIDMGVLKTSTASGFLSYEPYTKAHVYLPYVGVIDMPMRWLCGNGVRIYYVISMATGEAQVIIASVDLGRYVNTLTAQVGVKIPLASSNSLQQAQQYILGGLKAAAAIPAMYVNPVAGGLTMASALTDLAFNPLTMRGQAPDSALARMLYYRPFAMLETVVDETPANYGDYIGYPYEQIATLSGLSGRCEVSEIFGTFDGATAHEMDEIRKALREGSIF